MQCKNPIWISNPKSFEPGQPPKLQVPCGKCLLCRIAKSREWSVRILHESSTVDDSTFVTLTYDDEHLPQDYGLHKDHLQKFIKRLRRKIEPRKIRYYGCGEYGEKYGRPHYHIIIFNMSIKEESLIKDVWQQGMIKCGTVTYDSARYVADYIFKKYDGKKGEEVYGKLQRPFQVYSKGIGKDFAQSSKAYILRKKGITVRGVEVGLPRYYRKLLDIDPEEMHELAKAREDEIVQEYLNKGVVDDYEIYKERLKSTAQKVKNIKARGILQRVKDIQN